MTRKKATKAKAVEPAMSAAAGYPLAVPQNVVGGVGQGPGPNPVAYGAMPGQPPNGATGAYGQAPGRVLCKRKKTSFLI